MEMPDLPEPMRARTEALAARPPLETVRDFLLDHVSDADSMAEIQSSLQHEAHYNTTYLHQSMAAIEFVLAHPPTDGTLARLVGWDANWVLDDPMDAGAAQFLRELASMLRELLG